MHTPGPWATDPTKSFYVFGPAHLSEQAGLTFGPFICNASSRDNARLIAAAPALLATLQELRRQLIGPYFADARALLASFEEQE